jgi:pseudouridine-5'-phosphate glycosidase
VKTQRELGFNQAVVFCNPVPESAAIEESKVRDWVEQALRSAAEERISGKALTPYLLDRIVRISDGRALATNVALLVDNARVAAKIAVALASDASKVGK